MRTELIALLGLILGFFCGEALAAVAGTISFALFSSTPSGLVLWMLRSLPVVCALAHVRRRNGHRVPPPQGGLVPVSFCEEIT